MQVVVKVRVEVERALPGAIYTICKIFMGWRSHLKGIRHASRRQFLQWQLLAAVEGIHFGYVVVHLGLGLALWG